MSRRTYRFHLLNVFAQTIFGGNPLCVFEDARGLNQSEMQALAAQFNLSETTFIFPSQQANALVRIFTPTFEVPFAGHPTLGTAHVVRQLCGSDQVRLEMQAGVIAVSADGDCWTLEAGPAKTRPAAIEPAALAELLGLRPGDISAPPLWVDTGFEQLLVPLANSDAVHRCAPNAALLPQWPRSTDGHATALIWASAGEGEVVARFFFTKHKIIAEDPGTGSACANLGGWFIARSHQLPLSLRVRQGEEVGRPCWLHLRVDANRRIFVSGQVLVLGQGEVTL